ncbi:MAG TPA: substrate-binding domain-containing protein [Longimicrobiaceae bacterium]
MSRHRIVGLALAALLIAAPRLSAQYVVVVNPRNPVDRLTPTQVSKIFLGKLLAWSIDGKVQPVLPVDQPSDSPVRAVFSQRVLHKSVSETEAYWRQELYAGRNVPPPEQSEAEALATVRTDIGAIAYVSSKADLKGVKIVQVN